MKPPRTSAAFQLLEEPSRLTGRQYRQADAGGFEFVLPDDAAVRGRAVVEVC